MVIVNTVVLVQAQFGLTQHATAWALAAFGGGSMLAALVLPKLLENIADRQAMLTGTIILTIGLFLGDFIHIYIFLCALWFILGIGYSLAQTPSGRLLRKSAHPEDRPALFAAQFALSHACWLLTYPIAGWFGAKFGLQETFWVLGGIALLSIMIASFVWPANDEEKLEHSHEGLANDHPHIALNHLAQGKHSHPYVIDDLHQRWPR